MYLRQETSLSNEEQIFELAELLETAGISVDSEVFRDFAGTSKELVECLNNLIKYKANSTFEHRLELQSDGTYHINLSSFDQ